MLSKRVIAVSAEKTFQKKLAAALMAAGGAVEILNSLDELSAKEPDVDLIVYHVTEFPDSKLGPLLDRIKKDVKVITIIPTSDLEKMITLMKDDRLSNCLVAENLDMTMLSGVATRLLYGDVFGLEKFMPWGVRVYSMLVGDYQEKSVAIAAVSDFAAAMGVRRKYRESIEQCIDELLMNALYDAPVDADGKQMFAEVPTKTRISLRMEQKAVIQYACDGNQFAVSVRDSFGALQKQTVVKYIDKCLHAGSDKQIDRKTGGAGLGLYIIANSTSQFIINLYPGVATECVCTFALDVPKVQLKNFGAFHERIDASGRLVSSGGARLVGPGRSSAQPKAEVTVSSTGLRLALGAAVALVLVLAGIVLYPMLKRSKAGTIAITTTPPGATVEIDGSSHGRADPRLEVSLEAGSHTVTAHMAGHADAVQAVSVKAGATTAVSLALPLKRATVRIRSTPTQAKVLIDDKEVGMTPVDLGDLEPGSEHTLTVRQFGYVDDVQTLTVPEGGSEIMLSSSLRVAADFGSLEITSDPPGASVFVNDSVELPSPTPVKEYLVKSGQAYTLTMKLPGYMPQKVTVSVQAGAKKVVTAKLEPGGALSVDSNVPEARVWVDGVLVGRVPLKDHALKQGKHRIELRGKRPWVQQAFEVDVKQGDDLQKSLQLGFVDIAIPGATALPKGADGPGATRLALAEGQATLVISTKAEKKEKVVKVRAGETVRIETME